jgi:signal peptidase II
MKGKKVALFIALIIFIDQAIKFYIKLNFFIGEEHAIIGSWARLHFI